MDPSITADLEAPKDPGALRGHADVTDNEILGKIFFRVFPNIKIHYTTYFFYARVEEFSCIFNRKTKYDLRKNERLLFVELRSTQSSYFNVYCQQHV